MIKGQERFLSKPFLQNSSGRKCIFMTPMKWFYSFIKPYRPRIFLGLVLVTFLAALAIINPVVSGHVVDDVISGGQYEKLPVLIAILLLVTAARSVLRFFVPRACSIR